MRSLEQYNGGAPSAGRDCSPPADPNFKDPVGTGGIMDCSRREGARTSAAGPSAIAPARNQQRDHDEAERLRARARDCRAVASTAGDSYWRDMLCDLARDLEDEAGRISL